MASESEKKYTVGNIVQREMRMTNGPRSDSIVRGFALSMR